MKETEDCEGRTWFYNDYGIIRDVLQNHLTQILVLLKMDLGGIENVKHPHSVFGSPTERKKMLSSFRVHSNVGMICIMYGYVNRCVYIF